MKKTVMLAVLMIFLSINVVYAFNNSPSSIVANGYLDGKSITVHQMMLNTGVKNVEWFDASPSVAIVVLDDESSSYLSLVFSVNNNRFNIVAFQAVELKEDGQFLYDFNRSNYPDVFNALLEYLYHDEYLEFIFSFYMFAALMKEDVGGVKIGD